MSKHLGTKKPKPPIKKRLWLAPLLLLGSCSLNMIHVDAIADGVLIVTERLDVYVEADDSLSDVQREVYLMDNEMLRLVIEEAQK